MFRHESGIHCGGLLENRATYEPFAAEDVGHAPTEMVVGRHSGTRLLREKLEQMKIGFSAGAAAGVAGGGQTIFRRPQTQRDRRGTKITRRQP